MLEKLIKNIRGKISTLLLASILVFPGCTYHKTMSSNSINSIKSIDDLNETIEENLIDYSKLTWKETIKYVHTTKQVQDYLNRHLVYEGKQGFYYSLKSLNTEKIAPTFKYAHSNRKGACLVYACSSAAVLSDDGFPPFILEMGGKGEYHSVFLYRTKTGFGALGNTPMESKYSDVVELIKALQTKYKFEEFTEYSVTNLNENFKNGEWIDGEIDLQLGFQRNNQIPLK
jgi:hypothetical protein